VKNILAKLRRNKDLKTYIVHLNNGKTIKVRAKDYKIEYFTSNGGKCARLKFDNPVKNGFITPSHVVAVMEK
jgi:hypothetical protein